MAGWRLFRCRKRVSIGSHRERTSKTESTRVYATLKAPRRRARVLFCGFKRAFPQLLDRRVDAQLAHAGLQGGAFHAELGGGAALTADPAVRIAERAKDRLPLCRRQRLHFPRSGAAALQLPDRG